MTTVVLEIDEGSLGPCMRALNEKQRAFVYALVETGGNASQAAAAAGYGFDSDTPEKRSAACRTRGYQLSHDDKVLAAIKEEAQKRLNSGALIATSALLEIVQDPAHKSRLRAIEVLLDRAGLVVNRDVNINVNHTHKTDADQIERITSLAQGLGLDPRQLLGQAGVIVDAEFKVLPAPSAEPAAVDDWSVEPTA